MARVMHIVSMVGGGTGCARWGAEDARAARAWIARQAQPQEHALLILGRRREGTPGDSRWAFARLGTGWMSRRSVRREWLRCAGPGIVVCWGAGALEATGGLREHGTRVLLALPDPGACEVGPATLAGSDVGLWAGVERVVCAGAPPAWVTRWGSSVHRCVPDAPRTSTTAPAGERRPLRVALLGRAPHADALRFAFLIGLLQHAGQSVRGVMSVSAASIGRARRYARGLAGLDLVVSDRAGDELPATCDLGVWVGGGEGPTRSIPATPDAAANGVRACIENAVPFVAPRWSVPDGWMGGEARGLMLAEGAELIELARLLVPLADDGALRARARASLGEPTGAEAHGPGTFSEALASVVGPRGAREASA